MTTWRKEQIIIAAQKRPELYNLLSAENRKKPYTINSVHEFLIMDLAYRSLKDKHEGDRTSESWMGGFPKTNADQVARVAELSAAIMDFSIVPDKLSKRHKASTKAIRALASVEVQLLAWKILAATCNVHLGRYDVSLWTKSRIWRVNDYTSFDLRFSAVLEAVKGSKTLVLEILESGTPVLKRLAAAPAWTKKHRQGNSDGPSNESESPQIANAGDGSVDERGNVDDDWNGAYNDVSNLPAPGGQAPMHGFMPPNPDLGQQELEMSTGYVDNDWNGAYNNTSYLAASSGQAPMHGLIQPNPNLSQQEPQMNTGYVDGVDDFDYQTEFQNFFDPDFL